MATKTKVSTKKAAAPKAATKKTAAAKKPVAKAAKSAPSVKKAPAKKGAPATQQGPVTAIYARINIGWGNRLYLRGSGAGLSWDVGIPMECSKDDEWYWKSTKVDGPVVFKFLKNDEKWALGEDLIIERGKTSISNPEF